MTVGRRGQKECPKCGTHTGPRALRCKASGCNHVYDIKKKTKGERLLTKKTVGEKVDWKTLCNGDKIRVIAGYGPYYPPKETDLYGDNIPMGYSGEFKVIRVMSDGILARGFKDSGTSFIYMGEVTRDGIVGIVREPHKIRLITRHADETNT